MKTQYHNRLPHIAPIGATFFVTFRLVDALPQQVVRALKAELETEIAQLKKDFPNDYIQRIRDVRKRNFGKYDHQLDAQPFGACYLRETGAAEIVINRMREYDNKLYNLQAFCIMPNHVHVLFSMAPQMTDRAGLWLDDTPEDYVQLDEVMQLIKGGSAYLVNRHLGRTGNLWFKDSYDHYVRNEKEWLNIALYILQNPVKAGLTDKWESWPFNFCKPDLLEHLLFRG
jgi:putative transposase